MNNIRKGDEVIVLTGRCLLYTSLRPGGAMDKMVHLWLSI